ncbi:MAG TPA: DUF2613 family protein [Mycobacterium sp.]|nr:DUF2613 family protein [Mycobacterium sp.]
MTGLTVAAVAGIAAGLSIGAAATVCVTLALEDHDMTPAQEQPTPSSPYLVEYGDRCFQGHCLPCDSVEGCLNKLPPILRPWG